MTYLGKTESNLSSIKVTFVEFCSRLGGRQSIAEVNPHPTETLEELKGDISVEGTKQLLETGLQAREKQFMHYIWLCSSSWKERYI